jgi:hypothetical protein
MYKKLVIVSLLASLATLQVKAEDITLSPQKHEGIKINIVDFNDLKKPESVQGLVESGIDTAVPITLFATNNTVMKDKAFHYNITKTMGNFATKLPFPIVKKHPIIVRGIVAGAYFIVWNGLYERVWFKNYGALATDYGAVATSIDYVDVYNKIKNRKKKIK